MGALVIHIRGKRKKEGKKPLHQGGEKGWNDSAGGNKKTVG